MVCQEACGPLSIYCQQLHCLQCTVAFFGGWADGSTCVVHIAADVMGGDAA